MYLDLVDRADLDADAARARSATRSMAGGLACAVAAVFLFFFVDDIVESLVMALADAQ